MRGRGVGLWQPPQKQHLASVIARLVPNVSRCSSVNDGEGEFATGGWLTESANCTSRSNVRKSDVAA
jgi:hypothetical protein